MATSCRDTIRRAASLCIGLLFCALLTACGSLPPASELPRHRSEALDNPTDSRIGTALALDASSHPGQSAFRLLDNGMEAFLLRIAMCEIAERTLDVQYYIYEDDSTGRLITDALLRAADRGVRVRILIDDLNLDGDADLIKLDAHPRVEVRSFNPFSWRKNMFLRMASIVRDGLRINRRMHNKSFIVDNTIAVVGGRNIADEYFLASPERDFKDMDVAAGGPITRAISASFDDYWNSPHAYPLRHIGIQPVDGPELAELRATLRANLERMADSDYARALRETRLAQQLFDRQFDFIWAPAKFVADSPAKVRTGLSRDAEHPLGAILAEARRARREFLVMSPYFIPRDSGIAFFSELESNGVEVGVITNSLGATDVAAVFGEYRQYRKPLLAAGADLYEFKPQPEATAASQNVLFSSSQASLHSKAYVVDRRTAAIASLNMDPRSVDHNLELALIIHSESLAEAVAQRFESAARPANSYRLRLSGDVSGDELGRGDIVWLEADRRYTSEPAVSATRRLVVWLLSWLPLEGQL